MYNLFIKTRAKGVRKKRTIDFSVVKQGTLGHLQNRIFCFLFAETNVLRRQIKRITDIQPCGVK